MLDVECSVRGCPETYVQKVKLFHDKHWDSTSNHAQVKVQHKDNLRLFEAQHCDLSRTFGIQHYAGRVVYDTTDFLGGPLMTIVMGI